MVYDLINKRVVLEDLTITGCYNLLRTCSTVQDPYSRKDHSSTDFVRGLSPLSGSRVLVSFSPANIVELDFERKKLLGIHQDSRNIEMSPHGLMALDG
jgi:hypothetical protein